MSAPYADPPIFADREGFVAALPRRTAHAVYAVLVASDERVGPPTAAEVVVYDEEAMSARGTAQALRNAQRHGLVVYDGTYWWPLPAAFDLRGALESRFLRETEHVSPGESR